MFRSSAFSVFHPRSDGRLAALCLAVNEWRFSPFRFFSLASILSFSLLEAFEAREENVASIFNNGSPMEKSLYLYMCIYITTDVRWFFNYDYVVVHASIGTRLRIYKYAAKNNNPLFLRRSSNHIRHSISIRLYLARRGRGEKGK